MNKLDIMSTTLSGELNQVFEGVDINLPNVI